MLLSGFRVRPRGAVAHPAAHAALRARAGGGHRLRQASALGERLGAARSAAGALVAEGDLQSGQRGAALSGAVGVRG